MELAITLPDDIGQQLKREWEDLPRRTLEEVLGERTKETTGQKPE